MLKYLFEAEFQDGSRIMQDHKDTSSQDPKRSQFYDVLEKDKETAITKFAINGDGKYLLVDLADGMFYLNDIPLKCHENLPDPTAPKRLIFYRQHTHQTNWEGVELSHEVEYCIGWQTTIKGKNYKETLTLK